MEYIFLVAGLFAGTIIGFVAASLFSVNRISGLDQNIELYKRRVVELEREIFECKLDRVKRVPRMLDALGIADLIDRGNSDASGELQSK